MTHRNGDEQQRRKRLKAILLVGALSIPVVCALAFVASLYRFSHTQRNSLPAETRRILDSGERFVLLSLDPTDPVLRRESKLPPGETFHEYEVLGKSEIRDPQERAELLRALYKGIADSDGSVASCFKPRHGISATLGGETVDLVICFECSSILIFSKDRASKPTTHSALPTFNRALEKAGLPIAK